MKLKYAIIRDTESPFSINHHYHSCFELIYYHKATGHSTWSIATQKAEDDFVFEVQTTVPKKRYVFQDNTLIIIPPYTLHNEKHTLPAKLAALGFTTGNDDFLVPLRSIITKPVIVLDKDKRIQKEIQVIEREFEQQLPYYEKIIATLIKRILSISIEELQSATPATTQLEHAIQYLDEYSNTKIDFHQVANMCCYSYDHFRCLFKQLTGLSPKAYVTEKRYQNAVQLLTETTLPLLDISKRCGFENYLQFNRLFNSKHGFSPSEYRERFGKTQPLINLNDIE